MDIIFGVIIGVIVLTILVVVHELGHGIMARRNGVVAAGINVENNLFLFQGCHPFPAALAVFLPVQYREKMAARQLRAGPRLRLEAGALFDEALEKVPLDRECSMATMKDNEIDGCLLIEKRADKE